MISERPLRPFTSPHAHRLAVLLQLGDEGVALLDHVSVLLVLVVGTVRLDDAVDAVDGAGNAVAGDEFGEVAFWTVRLVWMTGWQDRREETYRSR